MPNEHVEIKSLNTEGRMRFREREAERRWLAENPGRRREDFAVQKFKPEYTSWHAVMEAEFNDGEQRNRLDFEKLPEIRLLDGKLNAIDTVEKLFDPQLESIRSELVNKFGDENVNDFPRANWDLAIRDPETRKSWDEMLDNTRASVDRNATRLSTFLADTIATCLDRVKIQDLNDTKAVENWKKTKLFETLGPLEKALKAWDDLLAKEAFPSRDDLARVASDCERAFEDFGRKHKLIYETEKVPYVRFQLLAAMRIMGETVAKQFASRASGASFSSIYLRLIEFPGRGSTSASKATMDYLRPKMQSKDPGKVWSAELESLRGFHKDSLRTVLESALGKSAADKEARREADEVQSEFDALSKLKPKVDLEASFKSWKKAYDGLAAEDDAGEALEALHKAGGEIAYGLRRYLEAVDKVLLRTIDWSSDPAELQKQKARMQAELSVRRRYQEMLDGFDRLCQDQVLLAKNLLS